MIEEKKRYCFVFDRCSIVFKSIMEFFEYVSIDKVYNVLINFLFLRRLFLI